jgi:hypothetical protein
MFQLRAVQMARHYTYLSFSFLRYFLLVNRDFRKFRVTLRRFYVIVVQEKSVFPEAPGTKTRLHTGRNTTFHCRLKLCTHHDNNKSMKITLLKHIMDASAKAAIESIV